MAYIGKQPLVGNYQILDALTATATDTYALTKNSVAVFPQTPANCIVSLNGVIQAPYDSYTISGSNIVFASALTGSDSIDFITVLGDVLNVGTVSDGTITTAKLADSSVSLAKLTATGTKDATTFLRGDNTFSTLPASGITEADAWRISSGIVFSGSGTSDITTNWERVDTDGFDKIGTGLSESSGIFTFPSTGYYYINFFATFYPNATRGYLGMFSNVTLNNSSYSVTNEIYTNTYSSGVYTSMAGSFIVKVTDTANIKFKFSCDRSDTSQLIGATGQSQTGFSCIKLAGV